MSQLDLAQQFLTTKPTGWAGRGRADDCLALHFNPFQQKASEEQTGLYAHSVWIKRLNLRVPLQSKLVIFPFCCIPSAYALSACSLAVTSSQRLWLMTYHHLPDQPGKDEKYDVRAFPPSKPVLRNEPFSEENRRANRPWVDFNPVRCDSNYVYMISV